MICMKCGREVEDNNVFCRSCREIMDKYPVAPGTVVTFPQKKRNAVRKPMPKKEPAPEEQIRRLNKRVRWLAFSLVCVTLALTLSLIAMVGLVQQINGQEDDVGSNYSTMAPEEST